MMLLRCLAPALLALPLLGQPVANVLLKPGRDASQAVDEEYTKKIREYLDAGANTITLRLTGYDQRHQFKRVTEEVLPQLL